MIANDLASVESSPLSSKLCFMVSKRAYNISKRLLDDLSEGKDKSGTADDYPVLREVVLGEIEYICSFYQTLKEMYKRDELKLISSDNVLAVEFEDDGLFNEAYLRKTMR